MIINIVILMAMQEEATPLINHLKMTEKLSCFAAALPFRCFQTQLGQLTISVVTSGVDPIYKSDNIGCEAATLMAFESIGKLAPDLMISAGTAGGFARKGAGIGTVYASEKYFVFHDRIVPMPGFSDAAVGCFPALNVKRLAKDLGLKTGVISSGSSLQKNAQDQRVIDEHDAVAKEMEAAAVAWVAMLHEVPVVAIKSITNLVDEANQSEDEFIKNFDYSVAALNKKLLETIDYLQGKTLADLGA
jgi:5'-methylthioadenosine nucleosidase